MSTMNDDADVDVESRREELFELNTKAWEGEENVFEISNKLDSSLKKNTAFIKKLRMGINQESSKQLIEAIKTTSLEKYINEISAALCESLTYVSKNSDIEAAVEIVSALHQRFCLLFTPYIELYFSHLMEIPKENIELKEDKERLNKIKNILKFSIEFYIYGIFRTIEDMPKNELPNYLNELIKNKKSNIPFMIPLIKEIMSYKIETGLTIPIMISILKKYDFIYNIDNKLYELEYSVYLRKLFKSFTKKIILISNKLNENIKYNIKKSHNISMKTGKLLDDLNLNIKVEEKLLNEFKDFLKYSCPLFEIEIPELEKIIINENINLPIIQTNEIKINKWENLEMKEFYEDIPKLNQLVSEDILNNYDSKIYLEDFKGPKFTIILNKLQKAENGKEVDEIVKDFWNFGLCNKASRNRLNKYILDITDVSTFRNIVRFLVINKFYCEEIIENLITRLDKNLRFQIHHDNMAEKEILIFSELVKFKLVPNYVIFHKIRTLILNIEIHHNIDLLSLLFDGCGNILLYDEDYKNDTNEMIKLLKEEYKEKKFSHTDKHAVRIFLMSIKPQKIKKEDKKLIKEEEFLLYLIKTKLNDKNLNKIIRLISGSNWENEIIFKRIINILISPEDIQYDNIKLLAEIVFNLTNLSNNSKSLICLIIDELIEKIIEGLEDNDYVKSRSRISQIIYFTEIINLKMIKVELILTLLYKIICFGHENNYPKIEEECEIDEKDDFFRIRMINYILIKFEINKFNKDEEFIKNFKKFIRFYYYYTFTKEQKFNLDLKNMFIDINNKLSKEFGNNNFTRPNNYEESIKLLDLAMEGKLDVSIETDDEDKFENLQELRDERKKCELYLIDEKVEDVEDEEEEGEEEEEEEGEGDEESEEDIDEEEEEKAHREKENELYHEAELDMEMNKIIRESVDSRLGTIVGSQQELSATIGEPGKFAVAVPEGEGAADGCVQFQLLSRGGGKKVHGCQVVAIPENAAVVARVRREQRRVCDERRRVKDFILGSVAQ